MKKLFVLLLVLGISVLTYSQNYPSPTCKVTIIDKCPKQEKMFVLIRMFPNGNTTSEDLFANLGADPSVYSVYGEATFYSDNEGVRCEFYVPEGVYFLGYDNKSQRKVTWYYENYGYYVNAPGEGGEITRNYNISGNITVTVE